MKYTFLKDVQMLSVVFHSKLFHAAGRNNTSRTKLSVVFTFHESGNNPIKGTRSARQSSILINKL